MSLYITSLNSGSNGNCYYIGNENEAVLIDAGISCREITIRMKRLGLDLSRVKALFISHEHTDHISGIPGLLKKYQLPVYITAPTLQHTKIVIPPGLVRHFVSFQPVSIGNLVVTGFPKSHDASDPHSFVISENGVQTGVFTDIGMPCKHVIHYFSQCHAAFLEANYCPDLLAKSSYPHHLKLRISGAKGHLSNVQSLALFTTHRGEQLSHLILSHLSKNNNSPELVQQLFQREAGSVKTIVASRDYETPVFRVQRNTCGQAGLPLQSPRLVTQLTLF